MKVKELITELKKFNPNTEFLVSSDEELNTLYTRWEVAGLTDTDEVVIYGFSGSEQEEIEFCAICGEVEGHYCVECSKCKRSHLLCKMCAELGHNEDTGGKNGTGVYWEHNNK